MTADPSHLLHEALTNVDVDAAQQCHPSCAVSFIMTTQLC